jgi:hypothetical protein
VLQINFYRCDAIMGTKNIENSSQGGTANLVRSDEPNINGKGTRLDSHSTLLERVDFA